MSFREHGDGTGKGKAFTGLLKCTVAKVVDLPCLPNGNLPTPYVQIQVKNASGEIDNDHTSARKNTCSPQYSEAVMLTCNESTTLEVAVFDGKEFLCSKRTDLELLVTANGIAVDRKVELSPSGSAYLRLHLTDETRDTRQLKKTFQRRRGAFRRKKIHHANGHRFMAKYFKQFTFCAVCHKFIFGLNKQGYACGVCRMVTHKHCYHKVATPCKKTSSCDQPKAVKHNFKATTFWHPVFCGLCGTMLWGLPPKKQGLKCKCCGLIIHKHCEKHILDNCGSVGHAKELSKDEAAEVAAAREEMEQSNKIIRSHSVSQVELDDFVLHKVLGRGSFGKVFLAQHKGTNTICAIKALDKASIVEDDDVECTFTEKMVLQSSHEHSFLTQMYCCFQTEQNLFFVMEYVAGGDLMYQIQMHMNFPEEDARFFTGEIVLALLYLHSKGIIYRDLKLDNVLLDSEGHVKIADFGMCKTGMFDGETTMTFCGTPDYIAPEILKELPYGTSVDWWALGVLLYEFVTGQTPFDADDEDQLLEAIKHRDVIPPDTLSSECKQALEGFLTRPIKFRLGCDPERPKGRDIKEHVFFSSLDWDALENKRVRPPIRPQVNGELDATNFDADFTDAPVVLTPAHMHQLEAIDQRQFAGFSWSQSGFS